MSPTEGRATRSPPAPRVILFGHRGDDALLGSERCLLDLLGRLDRSRFRPVLLCEQPTLAAEAARLDVAVLRLDPADDWGIPGATARARVRAQVEQAAAEHGPALVHANTSAIVRRLLPLARRRRVPIVAHHHLPLRVADTRVRELLHQVDVNVGVAEHVLAPLRADGVPPHRLRRIPNGVDTDRLGRGDARALRRQLAIPESATVLVSVASLTHRKAHDVTLRALAYARAAGAEDLHLIVCGEGPEREPLTALARELGISARVHLLGHREDSGAVVRDAADLVVSSSRDETLGLSVLEAQYLERPVIASAIPAHREALADGRTGLLVPPEQPAALATLVLALREKPETCRALGAEGRRWVVAHFGMDSYVSAFEALYDELLARDPRCYGWRESFIWPRAYTAWLAARLRGRVRTEPDALSDARGGRAGE